MAYVQNPSLLETITSRAKPSSPMLAASVSGGSVSGGSTRVMTAPAPGSAGQVAGAQSGGRPSWLMPALVLLAAGGGFYIWRRHKARKAGK